MCDTVGFRPTGTVVAGSLAAQYSRVTLILLNWGNTTTARAACSCGDFWHIVGELEPQRSAG